MRLKLIDSVSVISNTPLHFPMLCCFVSPPPLSLCSSRGWRVVLERPCSTVPVSPPAQSTTVFSSLYFTGISLTSCNFHTMMLSQFFYMTVCRNIPLRLKKKKKKKSIECRHIPECLAAPPAALYRIVMRCMDGHASQDMK